MSVFYERGRGPVRFPQYNSQTVLIVTKPKARPQVSARRYSPKSVSSPSGWKTTVEQPQERVKSNALQNRTATFQRLAGRAVGALGSVLFWETEKPDQTLSNQQFDSMMSQFSDPMIRNTFGEPKIGAPTSSADYDRSVVETEKLIRQSEVVRLPELYVSELPIRIDRSRLDVTVVDAPARGETEFSSDVDLPRVPSRIEGVWRGAPHQELTRIIIESVPEFDLGTIDIEGIDIRIERKLDYKGEEIFQPTEIIVPRRQVEEPTNKNEWEEIQLEIPRNARPKLTTRRVEPKRARSNSKQRSDKKSRAGQLYLGIKKFVDKTIGGDLVEFYFILTDNLISEPQTKYRPPYKQGFISYWDKSVNRWRYKAKTPQGAIDGFNNGFLHLDAEGLARDVIENAIEDRVIGEFSRRATKGHKQMLKQFGREGREIGIQFGPTL